MARKKRDASASYTRYTQDDFNSLLEVGLRLSSEKDPRRIMDCILDNMLEITEADGASIFLVERVSQETKNPFNSQQREHVEKLRFLKMTNRHSKSIDTSRLLDIDNQSIAGYVALSAKTVRSRDVYLLAEDSPFSFLQSFDQNANYRTKSVLAVPIQNTEGKVLGVLQLVNKLKADFVKSETQWKRPPEKSIIAFSEYDEKLMQGFASQAAIALDNAKLTTNINNLFESFVTASVTAIEARDPSTSGHSERVANLTVSFAKAVDHLSDGPFASTQFTQTQIKELRYAALLHDFGKIGVKENVLLKAKKLYPHELETILLRLQAIEIKNETQTWKKLAHDLVAKVESGETSDLRNYLGKSEQILQNFNQRIHFIREKINQANEPQVMSGDFNIEKLVAWLEKMSSQLDQKVLTSSEVQRLSIGRGTLSSDERKEIESHVSHTYTFLSQIAWTEDLEGVPQIAHCHHEKMDGTGYPRGLTADQIPVQARMMTISDIYDALTAMDRPYKKSLPSERAIEILHLEADEGKLDKRLLDIFIEAEIFAVVSQDMRRKAS